MKRWLVLFCSTWLLIDIPFFRIFWRFWIFICFVLLCFHPASFLDTLWKIQIWMAARKMRWTILFISEPIDHICSAVIKIAAIRYDHIKYLPNTQIHSECILTTTTTTRIRYSYIHTCISALSYTHSHTCISTKKEARDTAHSHRHSYLG